MVARGGVTWMHHGPEDHSDIAFLTGYFSINYIWPYIRRKLLQSSELTRRLQLKKRISLSKHEEDLAYGAVHPDDIETGFADIGGCEEAIRRLRQTTALMLSTDNPFQVSRLFRAPSGILLYGPPGCGKTMIAKALAKDSGVRFITLNLATLMDKWVGETEKYVKALFSLARKISPVIVFIDEVDALTRKRGSSDRDWSAGLKSQLLACWDGILTDPHSKIIVMGATNRPQDIDEAFLRRMPLQIKISLPDIRQRAHILSLLLSDLPVEEDAVDIAVLAANTENFSGSDLHELARRVVLGASLNAEPINTEVFLEEIRRLFIEKIECRNFY